MQNLMEEHGFIPANHAAPNFFDVELKAVYDSRNQKIPGYQCVQREDTGDVLALHSEKYQLISYQDSFSEFDAAIEQAPGIDSTDMRIATDLTNDGARVFRQYLFPAHTRTITDGDDIALRIIMFNSYDGSYAFTGMAGYYRFVCANTCVSGDDIIRTRVVHRGQNMQNRIENTIQSIVDAANGAMEKTADFERWVSTPTSLEQAREILTDLPQSTPALVEQLTGRYAMEAEKDGRNLWTLFNVCTAWATHERGKRPTTAQTKANREKRVWDMTRGRTFKEIAPARLVAA